MATCDSCKCDTTDIHEYNEVKRVSIDVNKKAHITFTPTRDLCYGCYRAAARAYAKANLHGNS